MRLPAHELVAALLADYAYGVETIESHQETLETFLPWLAEYMASKELHPRIPPLPSARMFFTNLFVARVAWWFQTNVTRFLNDVNHSGGIYRNRWGDAPVQSAALRLYGSSESTVPLDVDYLHLSTRNMIINGTVAVFSVNGPVRRTHTFTVNGIANPHFRQLAMEASTNSTANATSNHATGGLLCLDEPTPFPTPLPSSCAGGLGLVSYTHLRAHETLMNL
eukprot:1456863-Prymnesium_polylepis.2